MLKGNGRSLRCSLCSLNWPFTEAYAECPQCGDETSTMYRAEPMDADEARSLAAHATFERYYEEYDAQQPPERLVPGEAEAHFDA